ncbi:hypothetical protein [Microbacterium sp. MPKO10]|uniref:hypothetical protein n=1 Tax=Microbacterium sp. MPKO10 TaxID=2989818 RepID=UPI002235C505|nr:hypothetical protein [Microbacterium sp. MPKO10]MCW4458188.1 hypothetical protein [Microbacterium sp. MPKO10]
MSLKQNMQNKTIYTNAKKAWDNGDGAYTPTLLASPMALDPTNKTGGWGLAIADITSVGWVLRHWAISTDKKDNPVAVPVFTR